MANVACACLVDILIFLLCIVIFEDVIAAGSGALIFAITPIFSVWGLETSAEPIADGCIILVLWLSLRYVYVSPERSDHWRAILLCCAFTSTLLFSLTVKRENILLPIVLPLVVFLVRFTNNRANSSLTHRFGGLLLGAVLGLIFSLQLHLARTQNSEVALLHRFPLTPAEMIRMAELLLSQYVGFRKIYLSWDAASWHVSKKLMAHLGHLNCMAADAYPVVQTAPLPAGAQFLNVIESVFSAMSRAIIHNSDYPSREAAMSAIDEYFRARNAHFKAEPHRAGKKLWRLERNSCEFSETNNCKDPLYR